MFNSFILYCKWLYFLFIFNKNREKLTQTIDGGEYLKMKLLNLGILGIKLGQYLYSRKDIISNDVKNILETLLSNNKVHSIEDTLMMLNMDNNDYMKNIESIEVNPIGSGSLAQVHICTLKKEPTIKYILKVFHPIIFELDNEINVLKNILDKISYFKKISIDWDSFFDNIEVQKDLNNEANNMKEFYYIYKDYDKIEIPQLIHSNKYFIVMTFCEGIPINKINKDSDQYKNAINLMSACFIHSSYKYNICHGDFHQGNILVKPNGFISLIDFGICLNKKQICSIEININDNNDDNNINEIIYIYRNFIKNKKLKFLKNLLSKIIKNNDTSLTMTFIKKIDTIDNTNELHLLHLLLQYCKENNLILNGYSIYYILILLQLSSYFNYNIKKLIIETTSFMINEDFFLNENMLEYTTKLYNLENTKETKDNSKEYT